MLYVFLIILGAIMVFGINTMSAALDKIATEIAQNNEVIDSAMTLIESLAEEIRANITDQAALNALADQLDANSEKLADAVAANTPAEVLVEEPTA
jgi:predicted  nucleic acid-binding Zn-ribbon protein